MRGAYSAEETRRDDIVRDKTGALLRRPEARARVVDIKSMHQRNERPQSPRELVLVP